MNITLQSRPLTTLAPDFQQPEMTPFTRVERLAATAMAQRNALLARPLEFFRTFFHGRVPTIEEKLMWIERSIVLMTSLQIYENNLYTVEVGNHHPFIRLSIRRHDELPCKDWRHMQQIKNELVGPEFEAVELFPAESRLIDAAHQYHLWVHSDSTYRFPLGFFAQRFCLDQPEG